MILDAAMEFVWSEPFHEMTVNSLMSTTGVSRSAFYRHFSDLHAVMKTLLEMLEGEIYEVVQPWFTGVGDPVALVHETLTGLIRCRQYQHIESGWLCSFGKHPAIVLTASAIILNRIDKR